MLRDETERAAISEPNERRAVNLVRMVAPVSGRVFAVVMSIASLACGAAGCGAARVAQPETPTYGGPILCSPSDPRCEPLIVDLRPEQRADFDVAVRSNVAVVAADDKGIHLLRDCHIDG